MVGKRSAGDFSSIRMIAVRRSGGQSGRSCSLGRGAVCTCAYIMPRLESADERQLAGHHLVADDAEGVLVRSGTDHSPEQASGLK